ncbi:MAG: hypothetical protein ABI759_09695 [Candidatus Solibacter sp.]
MKFQAMLAQAIESSEIPLRFEPGATEAVARPVIALLNAWLSAHMPPDSESPRDQAAGALLGQLLAELNDWEDPPANSAG